MKRLVLVLVTACAHSPSPTPSPKPTPSPAAPITTAKPCEGPDYRAMDFWVGDWTVAVRMRASPTSDQWAEATGTQHVTHTLSNCGIEENFQATGPNGFAGRSFSTFDKIVGKWRQTWIDDSGGYIALTGGVDGDTFVLYGEPTKTFQMRMVYTHPTRDALHWEWQRSEDQWASHVTMMAIDYKRM